MNKIILMGRLTRDPEIRYREKSDFNEEMAIARYTIAVDRKVKKTGDPEQQTVDFINCMSLNHLAKFAEKYFCKGRRVLITGRLQIGSYVNKDGVRIPTATVFVEEQEFADNKPNHISMQNETGEQFNDDGYSVISDGSLDGELPFR